MIIIHPIGEFLTDLFPELRGNLHDEKLIEKVISDYYTVENIKPIVKVNNGLIEINISSTEIISQQSEFNRANQLCQNGKFNDAIPILKNLITKNPTNSEYHRTLGQAYSMVGDHEEGINSLIDALKWNPKNNYALTMIGNIFTRNKNDIETAKKYYEQVIENDPADIIAINNLGTNLIQSGRVDEGMEYFIKANSINPDYPNSLYGIALVNNKKGNYKDAFDYALNCTKKCDKQEQELKLKAAQMLFETSKQIIIANNGEKIFDAYREQLQDKSERKIKVEIDNNLETAAKLELAENYNRVFHLIKYNTKFPAAFHLMMHELGHLDFIHAARKDGVNKMFVSDQANKKNFMDDMKSLRIKLQKLGLPEKSIISTLDSLFNGLNLQIFNTPIDLFIEDMLYEKYPDLRPCQFISLYGLLNNGIKATTDKNVLKLSPPSVVQNSKILNLICALQYRDLFGIDLIHDFKPTVAEIKQANKLYEEFYEYRDDRESGEEYELIENWAKDLKIDKYFSLVDEKEYRRDKSIDDIIDKIERDPFDVETPDPEKEKEMQDFQKSQKELGTNMAVVMFMVDALQYFEGKPEEEIKNIAYEIALQGTQGYNPDKKYRLASIPDKVFSGYNILAYYYISWTLAIPDMLSQLQLPYDNEYKLAITLYKPTIK